MPERIKVLFRLGIVEVLTTGTVTPQTLIPLSKDVSDLCRQNGLARVLNHVQAKVPRPMLSVLYQYVTDIAQAGQLRRIRYALVAKDPEGVTLRFLEAVALDHGLQVGVFGKKDTALDWLQKWPNPCDG